MPHILLADRNKNSPSALGLLLETRLGATIVGEASTMGSLLKQAAEIRSDVVLIDWELPGKPEADRIALLRCVAPGVQMVVMSARPQSAALAIGADAFVNKVDPPEYILAVLKERSKK